jgi:regulator of PEP synthase PpsR (kinase-PPPase family)
MVRTGKVIPKEIIFPIIRMLDDKATWTNIYNNTINEKGKRYASNDIGFTLEHYLEKEMIEEQMRNKQTRVFSIGKSLNNDYEDFLKNVTESKTDILKQHVEKLESKIIFTKNKEFVQKNHADFTRFIVALEDSAQFYTNLLQTRSNSDYDDDSMTLSANNAVNEMFNAKITYLIKLTNKSIQECCAKLYDGKEQDEIILIKGQIDNIASFVNI